MTCAKAGAFSYWNLRSQLPYQLPLAMVWRVHEQFAQAAALVLRLHINSPQRGLAKSPLSHLS